MRIAVASGKGGTGKTLVATNLCRVFARQGRRVTYVDADVEAPNGYLFLKPSDLNRRSAVVLKPALRSTPCAGHGKCQEVCAFNAILAAKGSICVFDELCHSCGACVLACPDDALHEVEREIGAIETGTADGVAYVAGRLAVGEARAAPLIAQVTREGITLSNNEASPRDDDIILIDAPPGSACAAVEAVRDAQLVLLVSEPTPFGGHDLGLAIDMCRSLKIDIVALINRSTLGSREVFYRLAQQEIPVLAEIPFDRGIATAYAESKIAVDASPMLDEKLTNVAQKIEMYFRGGQ
jgi:MinD superfamily P-loop ATPase